MVRTRDVDFIHGINRFHRPRVRAKLLRKHLRNRLAVDDIIERFFRFPFQFLKPPVRGSISRRFVTYLNSTKYSLKRDIPTSEIHVNSSVVPLYFVPRFPWSPSSKRNVVVIVVFFTTPIVLGKLIAYIKTSVLYNHFLSSASKIKETAIETSIAGVVIRCKKTFNPFE